MSRGRLTWFQVQYHVQSLPVVGHLLVEASQVELVLDVVFVDLESIRSHGDEKSRCSHIIIAPKNSYTYLTEEFVSPKSTEP